MSVCFSMSNNSIFICTLHLYNSETIRLVNRHAQERTETLGRHERKNNSSVVEHSNIRLTSPTHLRLDLGN